MLSPRAHNSISYAGALLAYVAGAWLFAGSVTRADDERLSQSAAAGDAGAGFTERVGDLVQVVMSPAVLGLGLWTLHFARRTLESLCLFRFGAATVSWDDSAAEFVYYWLFALLTAWWLPLGQARATVPSGVVVAGVLVWAVAEFGNFMCHVSLRRLKNHGEQPGAVRSFPPARLPFLFKWVACPHYTFEVLSWFGFNLATGFTMPGVLFNLAGGVVMTSYAVERHEGYRARFPSYPRSRTPIVPYLDIRPPNAVLKALRRG